MPPADQLKEFMPPRSNLDLDKAVYSDKSESHNFPTLGAVIVHVLAWMTENKSTYASAEGVWQMIRSILGIVDGEESDNMGSFHVLTAIATNYFKNACEVLDVCVNSCILYYNCKSEKLASYRHAHRSSCPECGETRLTDKGKPRKQVSTYIT